MLDRAEPRQRRQKKVCLRHPYQLGLLLRCRIFKNWLATKEIQLLLVPESERTAGWPSTDPGEPRERVRGGNAHYHRRWVCHCLLAVVWTQQELHSDPGQVCLEMLRNKHLAISYGCLFIKGVSFVFDLTLYAVVVSDLIILLDPIFLFRYSVARISKEFCMDISLAKGSR
jgi:hypothetical protein